MRHKSSPNTYRVEGDDAILALANMARVVVAHVVIDGEDLERVLSEGRWAPGWTPLAQAYYPKAHGGRLSLHRFIMNATGKTDVDHRDHDTLNCRKRNLLVCTHAQNSQNRKEGYGVSSVRNVYWSKELGKWRVGLEVDGRRIHGGYFIDLEDAARAASNMRRVYMPYAVHEDMW